VLTTKQKHQRTVKTIVGKHNSVSNGHAFTVAGDLWVHSNNNNHT